MQLSYTAKTTAARGPKIQSKKDTKPVAESTLSKDVKFVVAWELWEKHRKELGHSLRPTTKAAQLKMLEKLGPEKAVLVIEQSITNGWQGLFPEKLNGTRQDAAFGGNSYAAKRDRETDERDSRRREAEINAELRAISKREAEPPEIPRPESDIEVVR